MKKNLASDIILIVKPIEGKFSLNSAGVIDKRLFDGSNRLHAVMDTQTSLWYLKYDHGAVPEPFRQRFTDYGKLLKFVTEYLSKRNVEIVEIID